jgi:beta-glucanase (GH16 family)
MIYNLNKMPKLHYITTLLIAVLLSTHIKAQIPINDSDAFNGTSLNTTLWNTETGGINDGHGIQLMYGSNIVEGGGYVKIHVDTLEPNVIYSGKTYAYQSGDFSSKLASFKYGYLEMRALYPGGSYLYWPAFWLYAQNCAVPYYYNEIDIAENGPYQSDSLHATSCNVLWAQADSCSPIHESAEIIRHLPRLDSTFHKYAILWDSLQITWYFDDVPVRTFNTVSEVPHNFLNLIFDIYVSGNQIAPHMPKDSLVIDYFNYYTLGTDCGTALTICSKSSYDRKVKQSITTATSGTCSPTFNTGDEYTLRATNFVELGAGTTINANGSGQFSILIVPCDQ